MTVFIENWTDRAGELGGKLLQSAKNEAII
jgi:hypothetical protein